MLLRAIIVVAFVAGPSAQEASRTETGAVSLVGCLEEAPRSAGFVLTRARPAAAGEDAATSAGAGASLAGEGPSGSVSGDTPTGSTATETSAPLPEAGEPDSTANPASATYNQGSRDVTTGTTGTVPRADGAPAAPVTRYRVEPGAQVDLKAHTGHTVRIDGVLKAASASAGEAAAQGREPVVTATSVRRTAAECPR